MARAMRCCDAGCSTSTATTTETEAERRPCRAARQTKSKSQEKNTTSYYHYHPVNSVRINACEINWGRLFFFAHFLHTADRAPEMQQNTLVSHLSMTKTCSERATPSQARRRFQFSGVPVVIVFRAEHRQACSACTARW